MKQSIEARLAVVEARLRSADSGTGHGEAAPETWGAWLDALFPNAVRAGFAARHARFWGWLWAVTPESDPEPFVGIWPRGGGKSTSAELGVAALGLRGRRRYALVIRDTQDRADDMVSNIAALLESATVARYYPEHGSRLVGKYGNSQGWRRNRLRTAGGFTVDALGLDVAARGVKLEDQRPDVIVFDDVDGRHDSPAVTERKLTTIRESLLPAGTPNVAVLAIQNLITANGVFARLADGRADFLARRIVSGPDPAVEGLKTTRVEDAETGTLRAIITDGEPTWSGQDLTACQRLIDRIGLAAFDRECQHRVQAREGALWTAALLSRQRVPRIPPDLTRIVVGVDPSGGSAEIGIVAAGLGADGRGYVLDDETAKGALGPLHWARAACGLYRTRQADRIVAEKNFGGDMVESTLRMADPAVSIKLVSASRGKAVRAEPVAALYEDGRVFHVGTFPELEAEMTGWVPGDPESPNRLDALVWALTELLVDPPAKPHEFAKPDYDPRRYRLVGHSL